MIPLLLSPPAGRPARVLGASPDIVPILQALSRVSWPVYLHAPAAGAEWAAYLGVHVTADQPARPSLRQASLVVIALGCPPEWRDAARRELEGSGVPLWDTQDPHNSTVRFPAWFPGRPLSVAVWGTGGSARPWEATLAEDLAREMEGLFGGLFRLAGELRELVLDGAEEASFRDKVISQLTRSEVLDPLLKGDYELAKLRALKIIGTTTRRLE